MPNAECRSRKTNTKACHIRIIKKLKPVFGNTIPGEILKAVAATVDFVDEKARHGIYLLGAACYTSLYGAPVMKKVVREINVTEALPRFFAAKQTFNPIHLNTFFPNMPPLPHLHHHYTPHALGPAAMQASVHHIQIPAKMQQSITSTIYNAVHPFHIIRALCKYPMWSLPTVLYLLRQARGKIAHFLLRQLWRLFSKSLMPSILGTHHSNDEDENGDEDW
jgi:hypothetical protein